MPHETDQQSLDDIRSLLLAYPGVGTAVVVRVPHRSQVHIRFRCENLESLKSLAVIAVASNVVISLGDPQNRICAEEENTVGLPCDIEISDEPADLLTDTQRFGVYVSADLAERGLISKEMRDALHSRWKTRLSDRPPTSM